MKSTLIIAILVAVATHPSQTQAVKQQTAGAKGNLAQSPSTHDNGLPVEDNKKIPTKSFGNGDQKQDSTKNVDQNGPASTGSPGSFVQCGKPAQNPGDNPNSKGRSQFPGAHSFDEGSYQLPRHPDYGYRLSPYPYPTPSYPRYPTFGQGPFPSPGYPAFGPAPGPYPGYQPFGEEPFPFPRYPFFNQGPDFSGFFNAPQPTPDLRYPFNQRQTPHQEFFNDQRESQPNSGYFGNQGQNGKRPEVITRKTTIVKTTLEPEIGKTADEPKFEGFIPNMMAVIVQPRKIGPFGLVSPIGYNHESTRSEESITTTTRETW